VFFLLTTYKTRLDQIMIQYRKQLATISTSAKTVHKLFRLESEKDLFILKFVDDYNYYIDYIDQTDQL
jgi:hypothetical protein